jgi:hypothetical protein
MELFVLLNPNGKLVVWKHNPLNPFTRKIVKDCTFDQDAVLIYPYFMKKNIRETTLEKIRLVYTTFSPKALSYLNALDTYLSWLPLGAQFVTIGKK